jgi:hypothetical protein
LYFCFKINCSPHDFNIHQPLNIFPLHINAHITLNSHINACVNSTTSFLFDTFWRSIRQEVTIFTDLNLSCETNSSLASQDFSRYFGIHTIYNRVPKSHKLATIGTKILKIHILASHFHTIYISILSFTHFYPPKYYLSFQIT